MKQDLGAVKMILRDLYSNLIELQLVADRLKKFGAPAFADRLQKCVDQIEHFQEEALKSLGEEIE